MSNSFHAGSGNASRHQITAARREARRNRRTATAIWQRTVNEYEAAEARTDERASR
ncbi:hypothetical protein [Leifsonia sp. Leaf264]|uniref:hypothetical protein n=1 Tax=Leifsonia sp. Leaf264 TaxID=1736314 RepID=UPI000AC8651F|nr:hypothetical protein [Leifsonia sp. Leaf264]